MKKSFEKMLAGYQTFRNKYVHGDSSVMQYLSTYGQTPEIMVVACCDSRVDPALILQCDPGDLFVARNVANIVPPYEKDKMHHGTSAALEFGIRYLHVKHLILLGHSQCGGIQALLNHEKQEDDFISEWVSLIKPDSQQNTQDIDEYAKLALYKSYLNCMTFPWIHDKVSKKELLLHLWYFDIQSGQIFAYSEDQKKYQMLLNIK